MNAFSSFRVAGNTLYISGQLPKNFQGKIDSTLTVYQQAISEFESLEFIAKKMGSTRDDIVKTNVFITDLSKLKEVDKAYNNFFTNQKPARSAFEVSKLVRDVTVEIDATVIFRK